MELLFTTSRHINSLTFLNLRSSVSSTTCASTSLALCLTPAVSTKTPSAYPLHRPLPSMIYGLIKVRDELEGKRSEES
ncbi:hypothetical protein E2C01_030858 [Portunus trituberculatus]|uniref:Uncharacterized protein n=1 Tax=Portunus trituberculatus TaxID=210409 RepID=A0A5B7EWZ2_PORTR|nr:hypothetical protein [Portunus trituberculatus]